MTLPRDLNGVHTVTDGQVILALDRHDAPLVAQLKKLPKTKVNRHVTQLDCVGVHADSIQPPNRYQGHQCPCAEVAKRLQNSLPDDIGRCSFEAKLIRTMRDTKYYSGPYSMTAALCKLERTMIFISPVEHKLLEYTLIPNADLSRDSIAHATGIIPVSVGRILTRLLDRGLIEIQRGPHRRILKIEPTFPFERGKTFKTMNPQKRRFWQ